MTSVLSDLENRIAGLSTDEQLWIMERLAIRLRKQTRSDSAAWAEDLAAMAADPEIQAEMRNIDDEFAVTDEDGLEES